MHVCLKSSTYMLGGIIFVNLPHMGLILRYNFYYILECIIKDGLSFKGLADDDDDRIFSFSC